jgi:hypothetical protein
MSERPTPETDAAEYLISVGRKNEEWLVQSDFARKLERERDDYKWQLLIATRAFEQARKMERAWRKEETNEDYE